MIGATAVRYTFKLLSTATLLITLGTASAAPEIKRWTTAAGTPVLFVKSPEIAMIDVRVLFAAGSARDGGAGGVANLVNGLLKEGAGDLDSNGFNAAMADTGARLSVGARRDTADISIRTLSDPKYADPALALAALALSKPRFDGPAIDRLKSRAQNALKRVEQSPGALADREYYRMIYGDHPYGNPPSGDLESVSQISKQDIESFYKRYYVAANAHVLIVGGIDQSRAEKLAEQMLAELPKGAAAPPIPAVADLEEAVSQHLSFPSIQSHLRMGAPGLKRGDPDYFPLLVGNHVLGGSALVSLLFKEIREKRGLSYGARSGFVPMQDRGPFLASLQTDGSQLAEATRVMNETIAAFIENGPSDDELAQAKKNLIDGFPLRINSNSKLADYIGVIGFYDLPLDYLETFSGKVAAVTKEQVVDAFKRRLNPSVFATISVGGDAPSARP
ncbi:MAG: pitrilysin family protein [Pseudomonadota bacterium]